MISILNLGEYKKERDSREYFNILRYISEIKWRNLIRTKKESWPTLSSTLWGDCHLIRSPRVWLALVSWSKTKHSSSSYSIRLISHLVSASINLLSCLQSKRIRYLPQLGLFTSCRLISLCFPFYYRGWDRHYQWSTILEAWVQPWWRLLPLALD